MIASLNIDKRLELLQRLADTASRICALTRPHSNAIHPALSPHPSSQSRSSTPRTAAAIGDSANPPCIQHCLPLPKPLTEELVRLGCNGPAASKISDAYLQSARELKTKAEADCARTLKALDRHPVPGTGNLGFIASYKAYYLRTLETTAEEIKKQLRTRLLSISQKIAKRRFLSHDPDGRCRRTRKNKRTTFNHAYVAVLELCFGENPYPTPHDKAWLAHKTGMTVKQISVWFQNRRNRAPKATDYKGNRVILREKMTLDDLRREAPEVVVLEEMRKPQESEDEDVYYSEEEDVSGLLHSPRAPYTGPDPFHYTAPKHAFPTLYPPVFENQHIKDATGYFGKPAWYRLPSSAVTTKPVPDLEEIIDGFAFLSVKSKKPTYRRQKLHPCMRGIDAEHPWRSSLSAKPDRAAARLAITTVAPKAPLAAFIPQQLVPSMLARVKSQTRSATSMPSASTPITHSSSQRPIAPLPKRAAPGESRRSVTSEESEAFSYSQVASLLVSPPSEPQATSTSSTTIPIRRVVPLPRRSGSPKSQAATLRTSPYSPAVVSPPVESSSVPPAKRQRTDIPHRSPSELSTVYSRSPSSSSLYSLDSANGSSESLLKTPPLSATSAHPPTVFDLHTETDYNEFLVPAAPEVGVPHGDVYGLGYDFPLDLLSSIAARSPKMPESQSQFAHPSSLMHPITSFS